MVLGLVLLPACSGTREVPVATPGAITVPTRGAAPSVARPTDAPASATPVPTPPAASATMTPTSPAVGTATLAGSAPMPPTHPPAATATPAAGATLTPAAGGPPTAGATAPFAGNDLESDLTPIVMPPGVPNGATQPGLPARATGAAVRHDVSPPLRSVPIPVVPPTRQAAPAAVGRPAPSGALVAPILNFDGLGNLDDFFVPDTNGDVGPAHYVQVVNLHLQVFSKTGTALYGPAPLSAVWTGFGAPCATNDAGTPLVLYDGLADRWVLSQYTAASPYGECLAVSTSGDPTGAYARYFFALSPDIYYDAPRLAVWPDGYYLGANRIRDPDGAVEFLGPAALVFDRAALLANGSATYQEFQIRSNQPDSSLLPADLDGPTPPPPGAPALLASQANGNLYLYRLHVDWATPANSRFLGPRVLDPAPYTPLCLATYNCIPQPDTDVRLTGQSDRLSYRVVYRNFGDHESLLINHTVDAGDERAGIRWYEVRNLAGPARIFQQGTYAPADGVDRWLGSLAMDGQGNIALGFSVVDPTRTFPGLRYTGRRATDPAGQMAQGEVTLIDGGGAQTDIRNGWGNLASLSIDPADDCTFWFTSQYNVTTGPTVWQTRIGTFKFPACVGEPGQPGP